MGAATVALIVLMSFSLVLPVLAGLGDLFGFVYRVSRHFAQGRQSSVRPLRERHRLRHGLPDPVRHADPRELEVYAEFNKMKTEAVEKQLWRRR